MASAEARASYAVNHCFTQDFRMSPTSSDQSSQVSKKLEPDFTPSDSSDSDIKWWLHVKTNIGGDANYTTCQHLNSFESEFDSFSTKLHSDNVKNFDALSCVGSVGSAASTTIALEQQWNTVYPKCMKKNNDSRMTKIEAALNNELYLTPKKKNEGEFWFSDGLFVDYDVTGILVSEQCKSTSSDLEPSWIGDEKTRPWWHASGKDDLASLVAKKSLEHIENCDLPEPYIKPFRKIPRHQPTGIDNDKNYVSSDANDCTTTTLTSGCSFQDSDRIFR